MSKESIEFHVKNNDYFGTLATVLSLVRQTINNKGSQKTNIKTLNNLEQDLMNLQKGYKISKK